MSGNRRFEFGCGAGGAFAALAVAVVAWTASQQGAASPNERGGRAAAAAAEIDHPKGAGAVASGVALPPVPPVTGNRRSPVPSWGKPLPYPIVIADRRNNRLIEVTPEKRIVWEFPTPNLTVYSGNEDVNFSPDGRQLAVSEEDNYDVHIVDYEKRELGTAAQTARVAPLKTAHRRGFGLLVAGLESDEAYLRQVVG
jgi:hypothetical protein